MTLFAPSCKINISLYRSAVMRCAVRDVGVPESLQGRHSVLQTRTRQLLTDWLTKYRFQKLKMLILLYSCTLGVFSFPPCGDTHIILFSKANGPSMPIFFSVSRFSAPGRLGGDNTLDQSNDHQINLAIAWTLWVSHTHIGQWQTLLKSGRKLVTPITMIKTKKTYKSIFGTQLHHCPLTEVISRQNPGEVRYN